MITNRARFGIHHTFHGMRIKDIIEGFRVYQLSLIPILNLPIPLGEAE